MELLSYPLALLMGLALGVLGGGGSMLAVPILVYLVGYGPKEGIAMSLAVVGTVAVTGAFTHWRAGNVHVRIALIFGGVAMVGSYLGAKLAALVPGALQLAVFGTSALVAAVLMFRDRRASAVPETSCADEPFEPALVVAAGTGVGLVTGFVGVGGGFLIVPALVLTTPVGIKRAVGISLIVIAMSATTGFVGYLGYVRIDALFLAAFTACAVAGILLGTRIVRHLPQPTLQRLFAYFLVVVGGGIALQNGIALL